MDHITDFFFDVNYFCTVVTHHLAIETYACRNALRIGGPKYLVLILCPQSLMHFKATVGIMIWLNSSQKK